MAYFHPWTLRQQDADDFVPWAGSLRRQEESWHEALKGWLEGNMLTLESARLLNNFLSVHRVRPQDDEESSGGNSDDIAADEDLTVSNEGLATALKTRVGGREDDDKAGDAYTHRENSTSAMQLGEDIWGAPDEAATSTQPLPDVTTPKNLNDILKAARASQSREKSFKRVLEEEPRDASLAERKAESVAAVNAWLDALKIRKDENGRAVANAEQLHAVQVVATRVKQQIPNPMRRPAPAMALVRRPWHWKVARH